MDSLTLARTPFYDQLESMDFVVNGRPMGEVLANNQLVTALTTSLPDALVDELREMLTGQTGLALPFGRVPLYFCHVDFDPRCGMIAARITVTPDTVVWSDFADEWQVWVDSEDDAVEEDDESDADDFLDVGPFEFERVGYIALIERGFPARSLSGRIRALVRR
jgi:hypothetical protein